MKRGCLISTVLPVFILLNPSPRPLPLNSKGRGAILLFTMICTSPYLFKGRVREGFN
jgi:hypothetical protein